MGWVWACLICMFFHETIQQTFWLCRNILPYLSGLGLSLLDMHVFHEIRMQLAWFACFSWNCTATFWLCRNILPYLTALGLSLLDLHVFHEIRMLQQIFWLCRKYFAVSFWVGSELAWFACFSWNLQFYSKHFDCAGIFCRIFLVQATNLGILDPFIESCIYSITISNCRGLNAKSAQGPPIRVSCCSRSCSGMC